MSRKWRAVMTVSNTEYLKRGMILSGTRYTDHSKTPGRPVKPVTELMRIRRVLDGTRLEMGPIPRWMRVKWAVKRWWYQTEIIDP